MNHPPHLQVRFECDVKTDQRTVEKILSDFAEVARHQHGVIEYQSFIDKQSGKVILNEIYDDAASFVKHVNDPAIQATMPNLMKNLTIRNIEACGPVNPEARKIIEGLGSARFAEPWTGFNNIQRK